MWKQCCNRRAYAFTFGVFKMFLYTTDEHWLANIANEKILQSFLHLKLNICCMAFCLRVVPCDHNFANTKIRYLKQHLPWISYLKYITKKKKKHERKETTTKKYKNEKIKHFSFLFNFISYLFVFPYNIPAVVAVNSCYFRLLFIFSSFSINFIVLIRNIV